jgi:hypothetical protein
MPAVSENHRLGASTLLVSSGATLLPPRSRLSTCLRVVANAALPLRPPPLGHSLLGTSSITGNNGL